jgi:hypothetical protein
MALEILLSTELSSIFNRMRLTGNMLALGDIQIQAL